MKTSIYIICMLFILACNSPRSIEGLFADKLTGNNAVSYTDVTFTGSRDTVLITTMSGRVAFRYKDQTQEKVVAQISDEIYLVNYNTHQKHIALSTLGSGIIVINAVTGKKLHELPLKDTWSLNMGYSDTGEFLYANDQRGNRFIWSVKNDYNPIVIPANMPEGYIKKMGADEIMIVSRGKIIHFDFNSQNIIKETKSNFVEFSDMDANGNILSINHNTCSLFNIEADTASFSVKHPGWLRSIEHFESSVIERIKQAGLTIENGYFEDPNYHMPLTAAKFGKDKIFTSSIDRSIRVWDKNTGHLLKSITGHKATINKIKVSPDQSQLVSIDLKGGIQFSKI